jgi:hypothetical protein
MSTSAEAIKLPIEIPVTDHVAQLAAWNVLFGVLGLAGMRLIGDAIEEKRFTAGTILGTGLTLASAAAFLSELGFISFKIVP